jgi:DnaJ-domain-containing protein 1
MAKKTATQRFNGAWKDVKERAANIEWQCTLHQGTVDVTEVLPFRYIADEWGLSHSQYDKLIDKTQDYVMSKYIRPLYH